MNTRRRWDSEGIPIPVEGKGLYLVEAAHQDLRAYTVVVVTDIAILTKTAPGRVLSFVTDRATRAPVADCPLLVWTGRKEAARVRTDSSGLADVRLADVSPDSTMVLARRGDDFAIDSFGNWNLSSEPDRYLTGLVYTDRPVYRPGHTVHWKAIVRSQSGAGYHLPAVRQVSVEILDPEGKPAQRRDATLSANGTVQGDMPVPAAAALGYYSIQVHAGEAEVNGGFHLEEYKKPEYEVRVTPETRRVLQGSPVKALISARYFFGEPVARAKVTYAVHKFRYWYPLYAQEDQDDDNNTGDDYYGQGEQVLEESGQLDADGKLTVSIPTEVSAQRWDMRYRIEARVTDAGNREIAGAATVLATHGSFLVNVQPDRYVYEPGSTAAFTVEARDYDGALIQTEVHGELIEHVWRKPDGPPIQQTDARTDAGGRARISFTVGKGGSYAVRVWANTPQGRQVESRCYIWVTGSAGGWYTGGGERLQIVPDKRTYRPGDIAKVLIVTGVPDAHVLVTAEGRDLYTRQVIKASQPTLRVEVPVKAEYAPNFFLNAAFLLNGKLYQGSKSISVPAVEQQLKVEVTPSRAEFKPGEPALYTITARDWADKPVSAEFSIGVVDEAIYSVRPETTPDIFKFFFGRMYNRVSTSSSLSYYFQGESGKRRMQLANFRSRRNLAQLKPEALVQPKVRKAFPDTALWLASLTTDAAGRAVAKLDFPDSLTTWRATVRGVTRDTKVGAAVNKVIVRKNLMVRLVTPRFFTAGDEVTISVLAHNYLKTEKTARLSLEAKGLEIIDGAARDLKIPVNGDVKADWRVRATVSGEAMLLGKALTNEESDAMELSMPVIPYGVKLSNAQAGTLSGASGGQDVTVTFPEASVPSSRSLQINVTPSVAGAIFGALEYLTTFPYGCTEQTMSSFLPNVIVSQALKELQLKSKVDPAVLGKKVKAGLDRLYDFQHEDGGWGWWQTDESHPFMTAYVAAGLTQARTAGYEVRPEALQKAAEWLRKRLESGRDIAPDSRAYGVYSLVQSGYRQKPVLDAAWELRPKMSAYGIALMGLALDEASDPRAAEAAAMLESRAVSDDREASWPVQQDAMLDFSGDATPEATAYSLKLLTRLRPSSPLLPKAALWLVNHRDQGYYWNSTKQTAMVIFGLTPYLKASGELRPDFGVTVTVNGRQVSSAKFTAADGVSPVSHVIRLPAGELAGGANRIRIARNGEGRLYWSARGEYYSAGDNLAPTGSVSLNLSREYFKMVPSKEGAEIVYQLEPLQGPVQVGDLVAAKLTLTGGAWRYLLVEDPIPAGAEFIEKDELYKIRNQPPWWQRYFSRREYHDDHAAIFQEYFDGKQRQHFYVMKIVNPGRFRISPARVQPMYQPQYLSTTDSRLLEVQ
ncbi:MAG TPA: MG2 domain-containing protein [Bryobacteraceae bacterium]|nr:MG2 domain-containing protein [Bryobacteraceae bacterium]